MATRDAPEPAPRADSGSSCLAAGVRAGQRCELQEMAPLASRAARGAPAPKVGHLPGRKLAVRTHVGGAQPRGPCWVAECGKRWARVRTESSPCRGQGVDRTSQVRGRGSITQPTTGPTLSAALVPSPRTETRGAAEPLGQINSSETCPREARTRRGHTEPARLRAAPERAGQQWALAILLCPARSPLGPGLLRPLLLLLLLLLLLPSAGLIAEPPACKVPGARAATSRRHCRVSVGARIPCLARLLRGAPKLAPRAAGAPRRCPWLSPRADFGRPTGSTAALLR